MSRHAKQVCVRLPASADNVTLLALAAEGHAAGCVAAAAVDRYFLAVRRAHGSKPAARCCSSRQMGQSDGQTVRRTPYR